MQDEILEREMIEHYPFDEVFTSMSVEIVDKDIVVQTSYLNASLTISQTDISFYYDMEYECFLENKEFKHPSNILLENTRMDSSDLFER